MGQPWVVGQLSSLSNTQLVAILAAYLVVWVILAIWVYRDASRRGRNDAALWMVATLFVGVLAAFVYVLVRD